jgi:hypothetical protein
VSDEFRYPWNRIEAVAAWRAIGRKTSVIDSQPAVSVVTATNDSGTIVTQA